jgi:succinoglycan biosynthesis transport protein ExoP
MAKYDINIRDYWRIIRKRRTVVILSTILFTVFSYLFAVIRTPDPIYEATSAVKVEKATDLTTLLLGTVSWTSWDNVATQAVIITSFPVFEESARQMGLIPKNVSSAQVRSIHQYLQVVNGLKSRISTEQEGNTNIINITATSSNGSEAALLANTVAEVYRQNNIDERNKKVRETREFVEKQLEVVESRLKQAEQDLRNYEKDTKLVAIDAQTNAAIDRLISLENEVADLQQKRVEVKRQRGLLQRFLEGKQSVSQEAFYVEDPSPQLAKLTAKFRDLSLRREVLLNDYTEEHPEVDSVDAELANVLSELDKELRSMLTTMDGRLQDLRKRLEAARGQAMAIPDSVLTLARLRREVELNWDLLGQLKAKYQEVMIQESGLIEEVKIIKPALEPSSPINMPNTLMNTVTGGLIGLVVGLVLALIVETMDTSLGTIEDVEEILGIPVLGVIPSVQEFAVGDKKDETAAKMRSGPLVTHFAPRSPVSEAYRSLRTNLQFIRTDKKAKVYLITSSSLQEGKTYNVVNLSLSLAQAGEKVLLIDADLRRPTVHHIFGLERQPGLTDYIVGTDELGPRPENPVEVDTTLTSNSGQTANGWEKVTNNIVDFMLGDFAIDDILKTSGLDNLHIINAGQGLLNPAEILRSPRFKEFLHEVREHYDIIIVDTPPVLPVADAFEVAPEVDGVILVYEVGRIGRGILKRAKVQLENVNTNVLGVILNNVKPDVAPDFYRYRTDYYYEDKGDDQSSKPSSRWQDMIDRGIDGIRSIFSKMRLAKAAEGNRFNTFVLLGLVGLMLAAGLLWNYYPDIGSATTKAQDLKAKTATTTSGDKQSVDLPSESTKAPQATHMQASVLSSEPEQTLQEPANISKEMESESAPIGSQSIIEKDLNKKPESAAPPELNLTSKPSKETETVGLFQTIIQIFESLPPIAKIRSGPDMDTAVLQRISQGTRLRVVGREGNWLKLQLRNGSTGWIFHSLAQSVDLSHESSEAQQSVKMQASVLSSEPEQTLQEPVNTAKEMESESESITSHFITEKDSSKKPESAPPPEPTLTSKPSNERETVGLPQTDIQIFKSLPPIAKIRSGPEMDTAVLQRIAQGTRLRVVGREGNWLKLQLRNGSTGWIFHSLAQSVDRMPEQPPL